MAEPFADAVIVAAGASRRMAGADKMEAQLLGRPILRWSVDAMAGAPSVARVIVVTRPERVAELARLPWLADVTVVAGGTERSDSVRAGLAAATAEVVLVHDGARPLVTPALVDSVAVAAAEHGAAVPVVVVVDSIKRTAGAVIGESVDRAGLVRAQTPQGARRQLLVDAFAAARGATFTDEAALLESRGVPVATVPGEMANLKVTDAADLDLVRAVARARVPGSEGGGETRIGFGEDAHPFGPEDGLWLGGILIDQAPRLLGHSDGDAALHALSTAILAASGRGDLGRVYPASDRGTEGIASRVMLEDVVRQVGDDGWQVGQAQVSIVGARPRLGSRLDEMQTTISEILRVSRDAVAVVASTGNLSGPEGAGGVIRATALVVLHRR